MLEAVRAVAPVAVLHVGGICEDNVKRAGVAPVAERADVGGVLVDYVGKPVQRYVARAELGELGLELVGVDVGELASRRGEH